MSGATDPRGGARVRLPPPLTLLLSILVGVGLRYLIVPPPLPGSRVVQLVVGALVLVAGLAIGLPAFGMMKKSGQDPKPWKPSPELLAQGIYRYTRNPMYVGMMLNQIGVGIMLANLWVVLLAAPFLVVVHYTAVLREEAYLDEKFGEPYREYRKKVRRYL
jgi:protein-S-isoprenylcysteine O-methyltransferase Ste14